MTVKELIEKLQEMPDKAKEVYVDAYWCLNHIECVETDGDGDVVLFVED